MVSALTVDQIKPVWQDGVASLTMLFALKNVTAGDTVELGPWYKVVKRAGLVSETGTTVASCVTTGTVVTVPTGPSADGCWLLVCGVSA